MLRFLAKDRWSPYLVGFLIGLLLTFLFGIGYQIGVSSGIARIAAILPTGMNGEGTYFGKLLSNRILFDWKIVFTLGILLGAFIASKMTKESIPNKNRIWKAAYGPSKTRRNVAAFFGGIILMIGARLADGCTSGHAISGGAQLSIVSTAFMVTVFATAIPAAFLMYQKTWKN